MYLENAISILSINLKNIVWDKEDREVFGRILLAQTVTPATSDESLTMYASTVVIRKAMLDIYNIVNKLFLNLT